MPDCSFTYDAGLALLGPAADAINATREEPIQTLVALGQPVSEFRCDGLSIWLQQFGPDPISAARFARMAGCTSGGEYPTLQMNWEIQFWSTCYPGLRQSGETIYPPSRDDLEAANIDLYNAGLAIVMGMNEGVANGFPDMPSVVEDVRVDQLRPLGPQGTAAGWALPVVLLTR